MWQVLREHPRSLLYALLVHLVLLALLVVGVDWRPKASATAGQAAAVQAAPLVEEGMRVGVGTGSAGSSRLPALARRHPQGLRGVATPGATERAATELGLDSLLDRCRSCLPAPWCKASSRASTTVTERAPG